MPRDAAQVAAREERVTGAKVALRAAVRLPHDAAGVVDKAGGLLGAHLHLVPVLPRLGGQEGLTSGVARGAAQLFDALVKLGGKVSDELLTTTGPVFRNADC